MPLGPEHVHFKIGYIIGGRYKVESFINNGTFGVVYKCRDLLEMDDSQSHVAVKVITVNRAFSDTEALMYEVDTLLFLRGHNDHLIAALHIFIFNELEVAPMATIEDCIQCWLQYARDLQGRAPADDIDAELTSFDGDFKIAIVMPYYSENLKTCQLTDPILTIHLAYQLVYGLDYLHRCGIVHRDMKPENIVMDKGGSSAAIIDFGLACFAKNDAANSYVVTRPYRPPENISGCPYCEAPIDLWSLGCIFYYMATGKVLFDKMESSRDRESYQMQPQLMAAQMECILNMIGVPTLHEIAERKGKPFLLVNLASYLEKSTKRTPEINDLLSREWRVQFDGTDKELWTDMILSCLRFFPDQRTTTKDLLHHPLFKSHGLSSKAKEPAALYTPPKYSFPGLNNTRPHHLAAILRSVEKGLLSDWVDYTCDG